MTLKDKSLSSSSEIPVLDMAPMINGEDVQKLAAELKSACKKIGFFYALNHGVPESVIENAFGASRRFFE